MFYCDACAAKNGYPDDFWLPRSFGPCEICGKTKACNDVPSAHLGSTKKPKAKSNQS